MHVTMLGYQCEQDGHYFEWNCVCICLLFICFYYIICQKAENGVPFNVWMKHCCMLLYWNPCVSGCFCPWTPSTGKSPDPCATGAWRFTFLEKWVVHEYLQPYYAFCVWFFQAITAMGVYIKRRILLRKMQTPAQVPAHTGMLYTVYKPNLNRYNSVK